MLRANPISTIKSTSSSQWQSAPVFSPSWSNPTLVGLKRAFDLIVSIFTIVLLSPILLVVALAVRLSSQGPILYRWRVVGQAGRPFTGYKFRSMCVDADRLKQELECRNEMTGPVFKLTKDPRITPLGRWMRRYSLDELPQLFSVVKGDMSLVGPRPPLATEYARFTEYQKQKLSVKPGITCLWQVKGRNDVKEFDQWVELDLEYIRRWNPKLDLWILAMTAIEVFAGSGK